MSPKVKGTVWEGYSRREQGAVPESLRISLRKAFPTNDADLNRELSRTLAMIEDDDFDTLAKMTRQLRADSDPIEDIHYLIVAARLRGKRTADITQRIADCLLSLDRKINQRKMNRESNWPLRIGEMLAELVRMDAALPGAMLSHPEFGRPDHAIFAQAAGFDRRRAAEIFSAAPGKAKTLPGTHQRSNSSANCLPNSRCRSCAACGVSTVSTT